MQRPGFSFCVCPDVTLIKKHIEKQLANHGSSWQIKTFWADEDLGPAFWEALTLPGLLGESRAVVLRNSQLLKVEDWKKFIPVLSRHSARIWPFFCLEGEWRGRKPPVPAVLSRQKFWAVASKRSWVWTSPGLASRDLPRYLNAWAAEHGLRFAPGILDRLAQSLPLDATGLDNELDKILLSLGERTTIEDPDLEQITHVQDIDIFFFLNAAIQGSASMDVWEKALRSHLGTEEMIFPFLALLVREARILWQLETGDDSSLRLHPALLSQKRQLAGNLGRERITALWHVALEVEEGIKSGRFSPDQGLEKTVSDLVLLCGMSR